MSHLDLSFAGLIAFLAIGSLLAWTPIFGIAYWRRQFGGDFKDYLKAYLGVSAMSIAVFLLMSFVEHLDRI
ncbi:hypothetical protein [Sandarakinorhabdus oryzae]|uniref:hypothetical protein n=1 Tax=Sandarakinorhabdus oryzae TaxID=2675220 RepID=UPI0012E13B95|nr:hypothetical protein [Sandarakinorhabdus oryzae]